MASYHFSLKKINRQKRSAIAALCYISAKKMKDERTGILHDYKRKKGVLYTATNLPKNAKKFKSTQQLWSELEKAEKRKDSVTAREIILALPKELQFKDENLNKQLLRNFVSHIIKTYGLAVTYAIHAPTNNENNNNFHAHLLLSTRRITADGIDKRKAREWDTKQTGREILISLRNKWEELQNQALEKAGFDERVSAKSLKQQGENRQPKKRLGVQAYRMEERINKKLNKTAEQPVVFKSNKRKRIEAEEIIKNIKIFNNNINQINNIIHTNNQEILLLEKQLEDYKNNIQTNHQQNLLIQQNQQLKTEILNIENEIKTINQQKLELKQSLRKEKEVINLFTKNIQIIQQNLQQIKNNILFINKNKSVFTYKLIQIFNKLFNNNLFNNIKKILSKNNNIKNFLYQNIHIWFLHYKKTIQKNSQENLQLKANLAMSIIKKIKPEFYFDKEFNKDFSNNKIPQQKIF